MFKLSIVSVLAKNSSRKHLFFTLEALEEQTAMRFVP